MLNGIVRAAPAGALGFDTDTALTTSTAAAFRAGGFRFVVRYLSRGTEASGDLSSSEAQTILDAGLALMAVQHVSGEGWTPTAALGTQYGQSAASNARKVGLPAGMNIWLDLEGVNSTATSADVTAYCEAWFSALTAAGYVPGLYVGSNCGLDSSQLGALSVQYFWRAASNVPVVTGGFCMVQTISSSYVLDDVSYDQDVTETDGNGQTPLWLIK